MARLRPYLLALALLGAGCGQSFEREDAVVALQASGNDAITAGCMADTLMVLDALDAADPGAPLSAAGRTSLVTARERCTTGLAQPDAFDAAVEGVTVEQPNPPPPMEDELTSAAIESYGGAPVSEPIMESAVQRLVSLGRDETVARCVVEQLERLTAEYLFDSPTFGLGATPEEASAIALCV